MVYPVGMSKSEADPDPGFGELTEQWRLFREHHPVGGYLPVGQLDGECASCRNEWPCPPVQLVLVKWAGGYAGRLLKGLI